MSGLNFATGFGECAQLGMKRHNLQPSLRESSESLRQQAASTNLPMPCTPASGNGVYALALYAIAGSIEVPSVNRAHLVGRSRLGSGELPGADQRH